MKLKKNQKNLLIVGVLALVAILIFTQSNFTLGSILPPTGSTGDGDNIILVPYPSSDGSTDPTPSEPSPTGVEPTSLTVSVDPNPLEMGNYLYGEVTANGKDWPITVHAQLLGTGAEQSFGAWIGDSGHYYDPGRQMNIPGYWDFWATTDSGVISNRPRVTVQGILIIPEQLHYSHTFTDYIDCEIFSHSSGNAQVIAIDAEHMVMIPMGMTTVNTNGYGTIALDFSSFGTGNYEITVLLNGMDSADFGTNPYIEVGR